MGGNLFKLGRMPRDRYLEVEAAVRAYLDGAIGSEAYRIPRWYRSKPDFGDVDVVVCADALPAAWDEVRERIRRDLGITRSRTVGPLYSTVYRDLQVDFFPRGRDTFLSTFNFLSFNDVGNLLGKMFHRLGLKYGEHGLSWVHRGVRENWKRELLLTRDPRRIFSVLRLDPAPWEAGFDALEDVFRWVVSSPRFSVEPYLSVRSTGTERLVRERRTMRAFVEFLHRERIDRVHAYEPDRSRYAPLVASLFPEVELERWIEEERAREARARAIDEKLNGRVVVAVLPHLAGKELGAFMRGFRAHRPDLEEVLLAATGEEVKRLIETFHRQSLGATWTQP